MFVLQPFALVRVVYDAGYTSSKCMTIQPRLLVDT